MSLSLHFKKIWILFLFGFLTGLLNNSLYAQSKNQKTSTTKHKVSKNWVFEDIKKRSNDHLMLQFGYHTWLNAPDSLRLTGFSNFINVSFMYDIPFKSNPHFSIAPGLAFSWHNVYFDKVTPLVTSPNSTLTFQNRSGQDHYEEHRLSYNNLEALVEIRYISKPQRSERSLKIALGLKFGLVVDAYTHLTNLLDKDGKNKEKGNYTAHSTRYFQFPQSTISLRVGYGVLSVITSYNVGSLFNVASQAPSVSPFSVGLVLSGL